MGMRSADLRCPFGDFSEICSELFQKSCFLKYSEMLLPFEREHLFRTFQKSYFQNFSEHFRTIIVTMDLDSITALERERLLSQQAALLGSWVHRAGSIAPSGSQKKKNSQ